MQSFHNSLEVKRKYVAHRKADEIIRGVGWNGMTISPMKYCVMLERRRL
jgi:hypothetical protein